MRDVGLDRVPTSPGNDRDRSGNQACEHISFACAEISHQRFHRVIYVAVENVVTWPLIDKIRDVAVLDLAPPADAAIFAVDEKPQIQASE